MNYYKNQSMTSILELAPLAKLHWLIAVMALVLGFLAILLATSIAAFFVLDRIIGTWLERTKEVWAFIDYLRHRQDFKAWKKERKSTP